MKTKCTGLVHGYNGLRYGSHDNGAKGGSLELDSNQICKCMFMFMMVCMYKYHCVRHGFVKNRSYGRMIV